MRIEEAIDIFDSHWDTYGAEHGLLLEEKLRYINDGMRSLLDKHTYHEDAKNSQYQEPKFGFENTEYGSEDFRELIYTFTLIPSSVNGVIGWSVIEGQLPDNRIYRLDGTLLESRKCKVYKLLSVTRWDGVEWRPTKWYRHNEIGKVLEDPFREPTDRYPARTNYRSGVKLYPSTDNKCNVHVLREPLFVWNIGGVKVHPEFSDRAMNEALYIAFQIASGAVRDFQSFQLYKNREESQ